jgi:hypothetical protein
VHHFACQEDFTLESLKHVAIAGDFGPQGLEGNVYTLQLTVLGFVNLAHAASSEEAHNYEASAKNVAGLDLTSFRRSSEVPRGLRAGVAHIKRGRSLV